MSQNKLENVLLWIIQPRETNYLTISNNFINSRRHIEKQFQMHFQFIFRPSINQGGSTRCNHLHHQLGCKPRSDSGGWNRSASAWRSARGWSNYFLITRISNCWHEPGFSQCHSKWWKRWIENVKKQTKAMIFFQSKVHKALKRLITHKPQSFKPTNAGGLQNWHEAFGINDDFVYLSSSPCKYCPSWVSSSLWSASPLSTLDICNCRSWCKNEASLHFEFKWTFPPWKSYLKCHNAINAKLHSWTCILSHFQLHLFILTTLAKLRLTLRLLKLLTIVNTMHNNLICKAKFCGTNQALIFLSQLNVVKRCAERDILRPEEVNLWLAGTLKISYLHLKIRKWQARWTSTIIWST